MARKRLEGETEPAAELRAAEAGETLEVVGEPPEPTKKIIINAFKIFTSRGRRLSGDIDDFPASEADALIASGDAALWP